MPQIGWFEILIIVSIAIIVVGPKDFPVMLKKVGSWIGSAKRYFSDVQNQVTEITDVSIKEELKKNTEIMKDDKSKMTAQMITLDTVTKDININAQEKIKIISN